MPCCLSKKEVVILQVLGEKDQKQTEITTTLGVK